MYQIEASFFVEEEKLGFIIPEKMKRAWAAQLKTLFAIDKLCKKYDIKYFADYGTLLGAIRHKGFIPWDDDIDLCMLRSDYMRFLSVSDELGDDYRVKSIYTEKTFSQFHTVVSNSKESKLSWDENRIKEFYGCPYIIGIDIDPLDYVPRDENNKKFLQLVYYMGYSLAKDYEQKSTTKDYRELLKMFEKRTGVKFDIKSPDYINNIMLATDKVAMLCAPDEADYVVYSPQTAYRTRPPYLKKELYNEITEYEFEMTTIPGPADAHSALAEMFGVNYMTPINAPSHGYPFYQTQEEYFRFLGIDI